MNIKDKKFSFKLFLIFFLYFGFLTLPLIKASEDTSFSNPNSDTVWNRGDKETIRWITNCSSQSAGISWWVYREDGSKISYRWWDESYKYQITNTGSYIWQIPNDFGEDMVEIYGDGIRWIIQISCFEETSEGTEGYIVLSDPFEIRSSNPSISGFNVHTILSIFGVSVIVIIKKKN